MGCAGADEADGAALELGALVAEVAEPDRDGADVLLPQPATAAVSVVAATTPASTVWEILIAPMLLAVNAWASDPSSAS
ncbi:hypothetical protein MCNS_25850 [Mycobacterium conspicuum]|uniref:Uncharacterized protein n=1 Tax=Mycobacterium conspicuum TaxID=44010 RepID=A0A7I7YEI5_9MYCO|nr:hypothetical protein MCNS_25850 [Mycobacterium conspicuum]CNJ27567.1 Uncharacterised protein [Mycobacterium tuberculosis]